MSKSCLVECDEKPVRICPSCRLPISGLGGGIGKVVFCVPCYERHIHKRRDRAFWMMSNADLLAKKQEEFRDVNREIDELRQRVSEVKDSIRQEVANEIVERIKRLSLWQRLKLLFNPFGPVVSESLTRG